MATVKPPEEKVSELLSTLQMKSIEELDVDRVAEHLGIEVRVARLDGCAANIVGVGRRAIVTVDQASSYGRQRYSIGHEIGHWIYDQGRGIYLCTNADLNNPWSGCNKANPIERRANRFAAELLMPRAWFREAARGQQVSFDTVEELRKSFQTSRTSTAIRLVELGSFLAMLIRYDDRGHRHWYCTARDFPERMYPHLAASRDSHPWDAIMRTGRVGTTVNEVDGDVWIDHPRASEITITEQAIRVGKGFLVLIAIEDEDTVLEILENES